MATKEDIDMIRRTSDFSEKEIIKRANMMDKILEGKKMKILKERIKLNHPHGIGL